MHCYAAHRASVVLGGGQCNTHLLCNEFNASLIIPPLNESTKHSEDTRIQQQYDSGALNMSCVNMRARKLFVCNVTLSEKQLSQILFLQAN